MTRQDTDRLISRLARSAATDGPGRFPAPRAALFLASALSLLSALALTAIFFRSDFDLARPLTNPWLYWKLLCMGALGSSAWILIRDLARPSYARPRFAALSAAVVLMGLGIPVDPAGMSVTGRAASSVPACLAAISLQSLPGIVLIITGLRMSTRTTRPSLTGAVAGLLAGTLAGAAYAFACRNDGGLFVFCWYGAGIAIATAFGSVLGRRFLAW